MPRQVRIEYPGAKYHVMCRGDRREAIFEDDKDRECFIETLGQAAKRAGWLVHAYVLMGNHYHLLLETPEPNLVRGMTWFQTTYTVRYNVRHHTSGHLYGGRYKAVLVEAPEAGSAGGGDYLTTLMDYIHLNPVRAGLIDIDEGVLPEVDSYRWSSLPEYRKKRSARPELLETALGFGSFNLKDGPAGRRQFAERVARRAQVEQQEKCGLAEIAGQGLQSTLRRGWCYGSPTFRERMLGFAEDLLSRRSAKRDSSKNYRGAEANDYDLKRAEAILAAGLEAFGIRESELSDLKKSADEKGLIAIIIRSETTVRSAWLAEKLQMGTVANVTRVSNAMAAHLRDDKRLKRVKKKIYTIISS